MNLKILSWNVNQRAGYTNLNGIPELVLNELQKRNSDIVCLLEYFKTKNHRSFCHSLENLGYRVFADERLMIGKNNEVLIALKKTITVDDSLNVLPNDSRYPDFLQATIKNNDKKLHIIGTRIKISSPPKNISQKQKDSFLIKDANERMNQINNLLNYVKNLKGRVCIVGDFNNYFYTENSKVDSWADDKRYLQNYYSYPLLVNAMSKLSLINHTPQGETDKVFSWTNRNVRSDKKYVRNDHIFSNVSVSGERYCWNFLHSENYIPDTVGYPDHAMLMATITI